MIASIDPGTKQSAFVLFDEKEQRIVQRGICLNYSLLQQLRGILGITFLAIELIASYGFPIGYETIDTIRWEGMFIEASARTAVQVFPVKRKQVLAHFRAKNDSTLRKALIARFGKDTGCTYDLWSALGIAAFTADKIKEGANPAPVFKC